MFARGSTAQAFFLAFGVFANTARAQELCIPRVDVLFQQGPNWIGSGTEVVTALDDARWSGSVRETFPWSASGLQAASLRAVADESAIYMNLTAWTDVDGFSVTQKSGSPVYWDRVYIGAGTGDGSNNFASIFVAELSSATKGNALTGANLSSSRWTTEDGVNFAKAAGAPPWLDDAAVWRDSVWGDVLVPWSLNVRISPTAFEAIGINQPKLWIGFAVTDQTEPARQTRIYTWPEAAAFDVENLPAGFPKVNSWGRFSVGKANAGCGTQVGVNANQLQITGSLPNRVLTASPFFADQTHAGYVQGRFRVADCTQGLRANTPWLYMNGGVALPNADGGQITVSCQVGPGTVCPADNNSCVLLDLSARDANKVRFGSDSALLWRGGLAGAAGSGPGNHGGSTGQAGQGTTSGGSGGSAGSSAGGRGAGGKNGQAGRAGTTAGGRASAGSAGDATQGGAAGGENAGGRSNGKGGQAGEDPRHEFQRNPGGCACRFHGQAGQTERALGAGILALFVLKTSRWRRRCGRAKSSGS